MLVLFVEVLCCSLHLSISFFFSNCLCFTTFDLRCVLYVFFELFSFSLAFQLYLSFIFLFCCEMACFKEEGCLFLVIYLEMDDESGWSSVKYHKEGVTTCTHGLCFSQMVQYYFSEVENTYNKVCGNVMVQVWICCFFHFFQRWRLFYLV